MCRTALRTVRICNFDLDQNLIYSNKFKVECQTWVTNCTGAYTSYYKKYSKEDLFMWWPMHENFILLHIRSMNFRVEFVEISHHVLKLQFYYIENFILLHYESLTDFDLKKCSKMKFLCIDHHMNKSSFEYFL